MSNATATTRFTVAGVTYTRELFVSAPDQVIVVRLTADRKGALNLTVALRSQHPVQKSVLNPMELAMRGNSPAKTVPNYVGYDKKPVRYDDSTGCKGTRFDLRLRVRSTDGQVTADTAGLQIRNASEAVLYLVAATSFNGFDKCPDSDGRDEKALANTYLKQVLPKTVDAVRQAHVRDYQSYANRVSLMLGNPATGTLAQLPTDERLKRYAQGNAGGVPADERSGSVLRRLSGRRAGRSARNGPVDIPREHFYYRNWQKGSHIGRVDDGHGYHLGFIQQCRCGSPATKRRR